MTFQMIRRPSNYQQIEIAREVTRWNNDYAEEGEVYSLGTVAGAPAMLCDGRDYGPFHKCSHCSAVVFSPNLVWGDGEGYCNDCGKFGEAR